jgi:hypothetical protein
MLQSNSLDIVYKAICVIARISTNGLHNRDMVIKEGGINILVKVMEKITDLKIINQCFLTLAILCRGKTLPKYD